MASRSGGAGRWRRRPVSPAPAQYSARTCCGACMHHVSAAAARGLSVAAREQRAPAATSRLAALQSVRVAATLRVSISVAAQRDVSISLSVAATSSHPQQGLGHNRSCTAVERYLEFYLGRAERVVCDDLTRIVMVGGCRTRIACHSRHEVRGGALVRRGRYLAYYMYWARGGAACTVVGRPTHRGQGIGPRGFKTHAKPNATPSCVSVAAATSLITTGGTIVGTYPPLPAGSSYAPFLAPAVSLFFALHMEESEVDLLAKRARAIAKKLRQIDELHE